MAEVVLQIVLEKLVAMASAEAQLLGSVRVQVHKLADDLEAMKAFLCDVKARCYHNGEAQQGFNVWVKQVREISYDTEDAIEEVMVRISPFRRSYLYLSQLKARHRLGSRIQDIRARIRAICERRSAFSLVDPGGAPSRCSSCLQGSVFSNQTDPRTGSLWIDEADTVGIDLTKEKLIKWLLEGESRLTAIFVIGMGGLGKTTLVKKAFDSHTVTGNFKHHAWVTVSKSFNEAELLRAALKGFMDADKAPVDPNKLQMMSNMELVEALRSYLQGERFIIVLDDIWGVNVWELLKFALPDSRCGSRIMITTRTGDVATYFEIPVRVHQLQPLPDKEAWTLFCMKTFRGDEHKGVCPKDLETMSLSILKKCGGLPLAIVAIGGMLSRKNKTMLEWRIVYDSLTAEFKSDKNLKGLWSILLLSYDDLPYYLKTCYLYLSIFPEDYLIKRMKLVRLWVVERFVEEKEGLTLEEVAEAYLNELVSRNMIQAVEVDHFNRVKSCRVHDIMREIIHLKSKEEALVEILDDRYVTSNTKARRLSIHDKFEGLIETNKRRPNLWSVLVFTTLTADSLLNRNFFKGYRLLRVVELERAPVCEFPDYLVDLIHLRYLSLRYTMISTLPESIGKLKNLEILDLKGTLVSTLPVGILQLKQLRQLRNYRISFGSSIYPESYGMTIPVGMGCLTKLQKLGSVEVYDNVSIIREMGKLNELRRLGLIGLRGDVGPDVCDTIETLSNLRALYISSQTSDLVVDLRSLSSPPQFLQRLFLKFGLQTLPTWINSLSYLTKLVLQYSNLILDPLAALQDLPSLVVLELRDAYNGKELCCAETGYPKLKKLHLNYLPNLESIKLRDGAMPELRELCLVTCDKLKMVPEGIENLKKLKDLLVWDMPSKFYHRIKRDQGEDFWKVQHVPTVAYIYMSRGGWVADHFTPRGSECPTLLNLQINPPMKYRSTHSDTK
uniref:Uncharacterized protein n=1 Tax=Kalanchoe fedtschenkoi TaxID=63787 RepID=A0A7N0SWU1_KALFE